MTNNIGPIIGAGLGVVAALQLTKVATSLVEETGEKARKSSSKTTNKSMDDKIRYMLGK